MHVAYVATFPLHCFNYFCTLTETSQSTRPAHFGLLTFTCYVYERSVILLIVDEREMEGERRGERERVEREKGREIVEERREKEREGH